MAAARRSTRLTSVERATSAPLDQATPRRLGTWRQRQTKYSPEVSESDEERVEESTLTETDEENNENCNVVNKVQRRQGKGQLTKSPQVSAEELKTPRRSQAMRPMPASKKRELIASKRKVKACYSATNASTDGGTQDGSGGLASDVSPPKQTRQLPNTTAQKLVSPSRLLDRLSIDEQPSETKSIKDCEAEPNMTRLHTTPARNKYQSARRVLNSAETENLPGREQQLQELHDFFSQHLCEQRSGSLYVSGQPGTGKTACLSLFLRSTEYAKQLQSVYINCTSIASIGGVYKKLCSELNLQPTGRTERDYQAAVQQRLRTTQRMLLIVLDEIDQLCSAKQSVLYTIFEWPAWPGSRLLLVGIANSLDLTERTLMRLNARCELKPRHMHFPPYTKQQIVNIFSARLKDAGVLDVFPPVSLQLLAAKVSAVSGDVRRALDIGRRVVELAEQQKNAGQCQVNLSGLELKAEGEGEQPEDAALKPVQVLQVTAVLNKVYGASQNLQEDIEESFPLQQKVMLCTLMLMLRNERHKDINMGRLHAVYRRVCDKRNIHAVDQAEFVGLINLVETRGILRIIRKKEPRLSKVVLQWDEEEVHAALCDKQLIASILDDTICLRN